MGQSPPSSTYNHTGDGLPFFQGKVDFGFRHPKPRIFCGVPQKIAESGDILISIRAPVGPLNISDRRCCIGRGLGAIRAKAVHPDYLYFELMHLEPRIAALGAGSTFQSINRTQLGSVEVNIHSFTFAEQRRIARLLSTVQKAIERQERLIALTAELKKALMHKLFTEGTRGEPLSKPRSDHCRRAGMSLRLARSLKSATGQLRSATTLPIGRTAQFRG